MTFYASARKEHALGLFAGIAGDYDRWAQILSFGQDARWHRRMIDGLGVGRDDLVADVATGTAAVAISPRPPLRLPRGRDRPERGHARRAAASRVAGGAGWASGSSWSRARPSGCLWTTPRWTR